MISAACPVAYVFLGLPFLWCTMKEKQELLGYKTILKLNLSSVFAKLNLALQNKLLFTHKVEANTGRSGVTAPDMQTVLF